MRNILLIMQREYVVRVRTKAFLIFTVLMPLLIGSALVLPAKLMTSGSKLKHVVIVSSDSSLADSMKAELSASHVSDDEDAATTQTRKSIRPDFEVIVETAPTQALRQQLTTRVRNGELDGFAWIDADAAATRKSVYYSRNASDFIETQLVSRAFRFALSESQLAGHGFSAAQAKTILGPVSLDTVHIDKQGANKSTGLGAFFLPYMLLITIYVTVFIYGVNVMRSVIEEKSSRVVEVLLGSVTPMQLMAGKIIGVGAVGLTQIAIWAAVGSIVGGGGFAMATQLLGDSLKDAHISTTAILLFPVFFLLGYSIYSCLYAGIGAICNTEEEAQQMQFPVTLPLVFCMICAMSVIRDPNTALAFWLSIFPLTAPIIMYVRISVSMPPTWQIALSIAITLATLYGLVWLTSRIYRVGILMYGKRPTLPEIIKWIRYA
jgi:ABC-2 type transport system permease protein